MIDAFQKFVPKFLINTSLKVFIENFVITSEKRSPLALIIYAVILLS